MISPLNITITWEGKSNEVSDLADLLYWTFHRNPQKPLDRKVGIPCYLFPHLHSCPDAFFGNRRSSVNIVLIDDEMLISEEWTTCIREIVRLPGDSTIPVLVGLTENVMNLQRDILKINLLRAYEKPENERNLFILIEIAQIIGRHLLSGPDSNVQNKNERVPPLSLFLSHTKRDGATLAANLKARCHKYINLGAFFDATNLDIGFEFDDEIEEAIKTSVFVCNYTDHFSISDWCTREVIFAKRHFRPAVVINRLKKGTSKASPYIGNWPVLNVSGEDDDPIVLDTIIFGALRETVRVLYAKRLNDALAKNLAIDHCLILPHPPTWEMINNHIKQQDPKGPSLLLLYPNPPLPHFEERFLKDNLLGNFELVTPALLPTLAGEKRISLEGLGVSFSISEVDIGVNTVSQNRMIDDILVELIRYLLVSGCQLFYAGKIDYKNENGKNEFDFTRLLSELISVYKDIYAQKTKKKIPALINYSAFPYYLDITPNDVASFLGSIEFRKVSPPKELNVREEDGEDIKRFTYFDDKYVMAKTLTKMRRQLHGSSQAHISIGGKWNNFFGRMPGVLEEIIEALKIGKPLFLLGGYGGATQLVTDLIKNNTSDFLEIDHFKSAYPAYCEFIEKYNEHSMTLPEAQVDYKELKNYVESLFYPSGKLSFECLNNGLSHDENLTLFTSNDDNEVIMLVLKGLMQIKKIMDVIDIIRKATKDYPTQQN